MARLISRKRFLAFLLGVVILTIGFLWRKDVTFFEAAEQAQHLPLLLKSTCNIPNFDPWDPEATSFYGLKNWTPCDHKVPKWSIIDHSRNELVFHEDLMESDGHPFKELECCYKTISRASGPKIRPDFDIEYSPCTPITKPRTSISSEFIVVECTAESESIYKMFHALIPSRKGSSLRKSRKMKVLPPNIIMLGLESTSRLNFRRFMPNTIQVLEGLGAKEMLGFTKVGDRTYPNMVSHLMGYHREDEVVEVCWRNRTSFHDSCPFIWRQLEDAGYLTAHLEDGQSFNGQKEGFNQVPVDFYLHPVFIAAGRQPCLGYQLSNEVMLDYVETTLDFARKQKRPIFNYAFAADMTHDDLTGLAKLDRTYASFLKRLHSRGHLDNSVLLVLGDHGYTYQSVAYTMLGQFESRLPMLWIFLPKRIRTARPDWVEALSHNSEQLTSSYAIYRSILLILKTFGPEGSYREPEDARSLTTGEIVKRHPNHQTFFEPTDRNSSCTELGIPWSFCACLERPSVSPEDALVAHEAAQWAVEDINRNKIDPHKCLPLSLLSVQEAIVTREQEGGKVFTVIFRTTPLILADFEVEITYLTRSKRFDISKPFRVSRMSGLDPEDFRCIQDDVMKPYCYCKSFLSFL